MRTQKPRTRFEPGARGCGYGRDKVQFELAVTILLADLRYELHLSCHLWYNKYNFLDLK